MNKEKLSLKKLLKKAQEGDKRAKDKIISQNEGLIYRVAHRCKNNFYTVEDLFQVGAIGMLKAIDKYRFDTKAKFSTFASHYIIGEIKMFLRDNNSLKLSRSLKENLLKIKKARERLSNKFNREATIDEISLELGLEKAAIIEALEADKEPIKAFNNSNQSTEIITTIAVAKDQIKTRFNKILVEEIIENLAKREKKILKLRYFLEQSQQEVGRKLGLSQAHISRLEKEILKKINDFLKAGKQ